MANFGCCSLLLAVLYAVVTSTLSEQVSTVGCTADGGECDDITNSACDTTAEVLTCKCNPGYEEDLPDGSACVKKQVSTVGCTAVGGECDDITNSACDTTAEVLTCKCNPGYEEDSLDGSACVKKQVSAVDCTADGGECDKITNSACDTTPTVLKCKCNPGHIEDLPDGSACVKVIGRSCTGTGTDTCPENTNTVCVNDNCACADGYGETDNVCKLVVSETACTGGDECDSIDNAECEGDTKKCKCSPNFVMNVDTCVPENAGASTRVGAVTLVLSIFTAIQVMLR